MQRIRSTPTRESVETAAPIAQVRADVARFRRFAQSIHSRYVQGGLLVYLVAATSGTLVAATTPLHDWIMHLAMYLVLFIFILFYLRAHQLARRVARALYGLATLGMLAFFSWALLDLIAPRLDVVEGVVVTGAGETVLGPTVVSRPEAGLLVIPVVGLTATAAWLLFHWLVVTRYTYEDGTTVL